MSGGGLGGPVGVGEGGALVAHVTISKIPAAVSSTGVGAGRELGGEGAEDGVVTTGHAGHGGGQHAQQVGAGHHLPRPEVGKASIDEERRRGVGLLVEAGGGVGEVRLERTGGGACRLGCAGGAETVDGGLARVMRLAGLAGAVVIGLSRSRPATPSGSWR